MTMKSVAAQNPTLPDFQRSHCAAASQRRPSAAANQSHHAGTSGRPQRWSRSVTPSGMLVLVGR